MALLFIFDTTMLLFQVLSRLTDCCLELTKIEALKMLDLQTKSAIISNFLQVQHQARSRVSRITKTKHLSKHPGNI